MRYGWCDGAHVPPKADAEAYGAEIERLREAHGGLVTGPIVLAAARKKQNVLHGWFEWDDTKAAEKFRLDQAARLIRVLVRVPDDNENFQPVRAFVTVGEPDEYRPKTYTSIAEAMNNPELAAQVMDRAKRDLSLWRQRYADLSAFAKLHAEIDATLSTV